MHQFLQVFQEQVFPQKSLASTMIALSNQTTDGSSKVDILNPFTQNVLQKNTQGTNQILFIIIETLIYTSLLMRADTKNIKQK